MIRTERLRIVPLDEQGLRAYLRNDGSLEILLGTKPSALDHGPHIIKALEQRWIPDVVRAGEEYMFSTLWSVILIPDNCIVAGICFKGIGIDRSVEIGYGTFPAYQGKGIMTETVDAITQWAFSQGVISVFADTDPLNKPSMKVLEQAGFTAESTTATNVRWRRSAK
jgi:RimJ/RimL family protein N-acetyltransferase